MCSSYLLFCTLYQCTLAVFDVHLVIHPEAEDDSNEGAVEEEDEGDESGEEDLEGSRKRKKDSEDVDEDYSSVKRQKVKNVEAKEIPSTENSLRHLKKLLAAKEEKKQVTDVTSRDGDGILSNEDFQRIRTLQVCFVCGVLHGYIIFIW